MATASTLATARVVRVVGPVRRQPPCGAHVGPIIWDCGRCGQPWQAHPWGAGDGLAKAHELPPETD